MHQRSPKSDRIFSQNFLVLLSLLISIAIVYGTSIKYGFAFEDFALLTSGTKKLSSMLKHLLPVDVRTFDLSETGGKDFSLFAPHFYRPTTEFFFYLNYRLFGLHNSALIMHCENLLLHLLNSFLVFIISARLFNEKTPAFFVSLLYSVTPVLFEPIMVVAGFQDTIMISSCLAGLYFVMRENFIPAYFAFILGLMSKETAIIMPALLLNYSLFFKSRKGITQLIKEYAPFGVIGLVYISCRLPYMEQATGYESSLFGMHVINNAVEYSLHAVGSLLLQPWFHNGLRAIPRGILASLSLLILVATVLAAYRDGWKIPAFAFVWSVIAILPFIFLRHRFQTYYLALSYIGFLIILVFAIRHLLRKFPSRYILIKKTVLAALACSYILLAASNSHAREKIDRITIRPIVAADIIRNLTSMYPRVQHGMKLVFLTPWQGAILPDMPKVIYKDLTLRTYNIKDIKTGTGPTGKPVYSVQSDQSSNENSSDDIYPIERGKFLIFYYTLKDRRLYDVTDSFCPDRNPASDTPEEIGSVMRLELELFSHYISIE